MRSAQLPIRRSRVRFLLGAGSVPIAAALLAPSPASAATVNLCASVLGITINTCDASAATYAVATPAGIAIGGNQITGLGNGLPGSAADINSIAIGNGATTAAGALSATAVGTGASVTVSNGVAIGAGSVANRAAGLYTAYALTLPQTSAGEFSVGNALGQRQITNVAAGSLPNDAVNVAQLTTVNQATAANTSNIVGLQSSLASTTLGLGTLQTTVNTNAATLGTLNQSVQALGTTVQGVNTGLAATNATVGGLTTSVAQNTANIATNTGNIASNTANIAANTTSLSTVTSRLNSVASTTTATANSVAAQGTQLAQNVANVATNTANIATNTANLNTVTGNLNTVTGNLNTVTGNLNTVTGNLNTVTGQVATLGNQVTQNTADILTNGTAVNGLTNQVNGLGTNLGALSATVQANGSTLSDLGTAVANGAIGPLRFSSPTAPSTPLNGTVTNDLTLVGRNEEDPVSLHNVANGTVAAGSTDAVNGGQVFALGQTVNSLTDLAVSYDNGAHSALTLGGTGATAPVSLDNVAAGRLGVSSTDAVNGAQLFNTNTLLTTNSNNIAQNSTDIGNLQTSLGVTNDTLTNQASQLLTLGGRIDQNTTSIASTVANVASLTGVVQQNGQDITNLGTQVTAQNGQIEANADAIGLNADAIVQLRQLSATGAIGPVRYSDAATPTTPNGGVVSNDVTIVGATSAPVGVHNVAAGTVSATSTDAINGSQLYAFTSQIGSGDGLAVAYDDNSKAQVTLGGVTATTPTLLTNLADGRIAAGSTDAVTGNQLYQTNGAVTTVSNRVDQLDTTVTNNYMTVNQTLSSLGSSVTSLVQSAVTYDDAAHTQVTFGAAGTPVTLTNVAAGQVAAGSTDAVNGSQLFDTNTTVANNYNTLNQSITNVGAGLSQLQTSAVTYDDASHTHVSLGAAGTPVTLSNVADGQVALGSTDAVNGNQLAQTNQSVTNVNTRVDTLNNSYTNLSTNIANGGIGPVQYSYALTPTVANGGHPTNDLTLVGAIPAAPVGLHNVAAGQLSATSTDAVNGSQLFAVASQISSSDGLAVSYTDGSKSQVALGGILATAPVSLTNVAAGQVAAGSTDAVNGNQLFNTNTTVANNYTTLNQSITNVGAGLSQLQTLAVTYDDASHNHVSLGAAGTPVTLSNVADGQVALGSTDAVNGNQLAQTNQSVTNVNTRVDTLNGAVTTNTANIALLNNNYTSFSTSVANGGVGPVQYSNPTTPTVANGGHPTNDLTLVGAATAAPVGLHNVADGTVSATSTDAVNGSQLFAVASQISGGDGLAVSYTDASKSQVALGGVLATAPVSLTNVAAGQVAAGSTDAVNGSQLFDTNTTVANNYTTLNQSITNVGAGLSQLQTSAVTYDDASHTHVTLGAAGTPVTLSNVADGQVALGSTDAVNGNQLAQTNQSVTNVNTRVDTLNNSYTNLTTNIANGGIGPVQYADAATPTVANGGTPTNDLTLVGAVAAAPVGLHNVAAGQLSATSTDAINGSQLTGLGSAVAASLGAMTYNPATNSYSGNFTYGGNSYGNVQAVFNAINANFSTDGTGGGTTDTASKYFHTNSTLADSSASGMNSTAIGPSAVSSGSQSVAMGDGAQAQSDQSVAIGTGATASNGRSVSIGQGNTASGNGAVALGDPSVATGDGAVVAGKDDTATGTGAIAMGNTSTALGDGAVSLGNVNTANGLGAVALGSANTATGDGAIAIGSNNTATGDKSLAIGSNVTTSADDTLSVGNSTVANASSAVAFGNRAMANGVRSLSVGTDTSATGEEASSFGTHSHATADFATAIGADSEANAYQSAAFGSEAVANGYQSTAVGANSAASGYLAMSIGEGASASGIASTAVGTQSIASGDGSVAIGTGAVATANTSVALGTAALAERGAQSNYSAFGLSGAQNSVGEVAVASSIVYTGPDGGTTPVGQRQITGVAAGSADTDAVNISQLRGVSDTIGTVVATGLGGGATYSTTSGALTGPSYTLFGTNYNNVGDALQALASYDSTNGGTGGTGGGITNPSIVTYADDTHNAVNLAGNGTTIHNVAAGAVSSTSTDAVNGSQLDATNTQVAANTTAIGTLNTQVAANTSAISTLDTQVQNGAIGTVQYSNSDTPTQANGGTKTNDVTLVGASSAAPVGLHNVAAGTVSTGSTDAVNGGQLAATNAQVATAQTTANTALVMGQNSIQYDSGGSSVTLGGTSAPTAVAVHNVANGTAAGDAVNLSQLVGAANTAIGQSNAYTDNRIAAVQFDLSKVRKDANAGTAGAMAMASMPQPYEAGKGMISAGMGAYQGQTAIAMGIAKALADEHTVIKLAATYNTRGQVGLSGGIGYQF